MTERLFKDLTVNEWLLGDLTVGKKVARHPNEGWGKGPNGV